MRLSLSWVVTQVNRVLASLSSAVPGPPEAKSTSNDSHIPYPHTSRPVHNQGSFPDADVFDFPTGEGPSIISQHEVTMKDMCATHNGWSCLVHDQGSLPDIDHHDFLTGGGPSTEVERPPCIDPRSSNFSGYDAFNPYQLPTSDPQSGTSVEGPYLLDPQSQYPPHPTTYCVPDGNHPGAFNHGHNSSYLSDAVPGEPRRGLTIDVSGIGHQVAPSLRSNLSFDYGCRTVFNPRKLFVRSGATRAASEASYLANPDPPLGENHPRSIYSLPNGCPHGKFDDSLNPDLGNASPAQLPYLTLDTGFFRSDSPPSLNSASTDATVCPSDTVSLQPPTYLETTYSPGIKSVGSALMRMASNRRRRKRGGHPCPFPECSADFTSLHNREYHMNAHLGLRPYKCAYKAFGCIYKASAPRTVKRHNETCKYKPENN